ncbi:MAG TPA: hypothetical protein VFA39_18920 [Steroidobacteraceae bacterium]|nr:hypothetical protein [Steroidobacteraceae bacterium]
MKVPATTVEFLDALKAQKGLTSDYQLWKALGWKQATMSSYRCGRTAMSGAHAIRIADELTLPRAYVLACMEAERENDDQVADVWQELARRLKGAAAIILIALLFGGGAKNAIAAGVSAPSSAIGASRSLYIMLIKG